MYDPRKREAGPATRFRANGVAEAVGRLLRVDKGGVASIPLTRVDVGLFVADVHESLCRDTGTRDMAGRAVYDCSFTLTVVSVADEECMVEDSKGWQKVKATSQLFFREALAANE
jgi:hypothetical protein